MPRKTYSSITIKKYLQKILVKRSKELKITVPVYLELLMKISKIKNWEICFLDGDQKNQQISNMILREKLGH